MGRDGSAAGDLDLGALARTARAPCWKCLPSTPRQTPRIKTTRLTATAAETICLIDPNAARV